MNFREMTEADLPFFLKVRNESAEWLHDPRQFTMEECREWFKSLPPEHKYYIIEFRSANRTLPYQAGYFRIQECGPNFAEIGADLAPEFRGKGVAFDAYEQFIEWYKDFKKVNTLCLGLFVLGHNIRAINLYTKLGFSLCEAPIELVKRNGRLYPSIEMYKWV